MAFEILQALRNTASLHICIYTSPHGREMSARMAYLMGSFRSSDRYSMQAQRNAAHETNDFNNRGISKS